MFRISLKLVCSSAYITSFWRAIEEAGEAQYACVKFEPLLSRVECIILLALFYISHLWTARQTGLRSFYLSLRFRGKQDMLQTIIIMIWQIFDFYPKGVYFECKVWISRPAITDVPKLTQRVGSKEK